LGNNPSVKSHIPCIARPSVLKDLQRFQIEKLAYPKTSMNDKEKIAHRLALLQDVNLAQADLDAIVGELEDLDRIVAELEEFGQSTPWISQQIQPAT
jgi:hypothetical protein